MKGRLTVPKGTSLNDAAWFACGMVGDVGRTMTLEFNGVPVDVTPSMSPGQVEAAYRRLVAVQS